MWFFPSKSLPGLQPAEYIITIASGGYWLWTSEKQFQLMNWLYYGFLLWFIIPKQFPTGSKWIKSSKAPSNKTYCNFKLLRRIWRCSSAPVPLTPGLNIYGGRTSPFIWLRSSVVHSFSLGTSPHTILKASALNKALGSMLVWRFKVKASKILHFVK